MKLSKRAVWDVIPAGHTQSVGILKQTTDNEGAYWIVKLSNGQSFHKRVDGKVRRRKAITVPADVRTWLKRLFREQ